MDISIYSGTGLPTRLQSDWRQLCRQNRAYDSPFFDPAFTMAVAQARPDVKIAVIEQNGVLAGITRTKRAYRQWRMCPDDAEQALKQATFPSASSHTLQLE